MIIGKFTEKNGTFIGNVICGLAALPATIKPLERGPDYLVTTPYGELGAAWRRKSGKGNDYLSVRLDSPFLPAPVNCALVRQVDGYALVWSRDNRGDAAAQG